MATSFHDALKRGLGWCWALEIEGIPHLFVERKLKLTTPSTTTAADPASGATVVAGLIVDTAGTITTELDREKGIGRGAPLKFVLHHDDLEDAGVLDDLFARPSQALKLGADLTSTMTAALVAHSDVAAAGFPSSGHVYLGKETIAFTGTSGDAFTGLTRGKYNGSPHVFNTDSFTEYLWITNRPQAWRGRFVRLYRCLTAPSGHLLSTQWLAGDYSRCEWVGYLDALPRPSIAGMELSALPLERKLAEETGYTSTWEVSSAAPFLVGQELVVQIAQSGVGFIHSDTFRIGPDDMPSSPLFNGDFDLVAFLPSTYQTGRGHSNQMNYLMSSLRQWISNETAELSTLGSVGAGSGPVSEVTTLGINATDAEKATGGCSSFYIGAGPLSLDLLLLNVSSPAGTGIPWFKPFEDGPHGGIKRHFSGKFNTGTEDGIYIGLTLKESNGWTDTELPSSGIGVLSSGGVEEVVRFSDKVAYSKIATSSVADITGFVKLKNRGVSNTPRAELMEQNSGKLLSAELKLGLGDQGFAWEVALVVLESSGGGELGDSDTAALGFGYAIPAAYINESSFDDADAWALGQAFCVAFKAGGASFEGLLGGYLALSSSCVTQRYDTATNTKRLEVVGTNVAAWESSPDTLTITASDIMLTGLGDLETIRSPNTINLDLTGIGGEAPKTTIRDIPRAQLEGGYAWDIDVPGCELGKAQAMAMQLIAYGASFFALELPLAAWVDIEPGDRAILDLSSHPLTFDFQNGAHPMASAVAGRCTAVKLNMSTGQQRATFLLHGASHPPLVLAPTAALLGTVSTDKITISEADGAWFAAADVLELYDPGLEDSSGRITQRTIDSLSTAGGVTTITLTTAFPAWTSTSVRATFPPYASTTAAQKAHAYYNQNAIYRWT